MLGGDPEDLRRHARDIRSWAGDVDADATRVRRARHVTWQSTAATSFRARIAEKAADVQAVAGDMRHAADKIDRLADTLESRQHTLEHLLEQAGKTVADAEEWVRNGATDVLDHAQGLANEALDTAKDLAGKAKSGLDTVTGGLL